MTAFPDRTQVGTRLFLVEYYMPSGTSGRVTAAVDRLTAAVGRGCAGGAVLTFVSCVLLPEDDTLFCLFDGDSQGHLEEVLVSAGVGYERIVEAFEIRLRATGEGTRA
jgi:hypothetical protein